MNTGFLASVVIPTYKRADLVTRAIRSALAQTYGNVEVIVVDDGSQDRTKDVVASNQDPRVRFVAHPSNRGISATRNSGIEAARGEYVAFLDSDDEWLPEKLSTQIAAMREHNAAFSYCQTYLEQAAGQYEVCPRQPFSGGSLLRYMFCEQGMMQASSFVVRRELALPFDTGLNTFEDWDWALRVHQINPDMLFIEKPLYYLHNDAPRRDRNERPVSLQQRAQPFVEKYAKEIAGDSRIKRFLGWSFVRAALAQGAKEQARSILREYRVYPSLTKRPHALLLWLKCF